MKLSSEQLAAQIEEFLSQGNEIQVIETPEYDYSNYKPVEIETNKDII